jgi:hypothetical protein
MFLYYLYTGIEERRDENRWRRKIEKENGDRRREKRREVEKHCI